MFVVNGPEQIEVTAVDGKEGKLEIRFDHFDSFLDLNSSRSPPWSFRGKWRKRVDSNTWTEMDCTLHCGRPNRFTPLQTPDGTPREVRPITGRWAVQFSKSDDPAVGVFKQSDGGIVEGTFLTTTGDYRYLAGSYEYGRLRLSCFDGAHAFLFDATIQPDGTLKGDFWSRDAWHENWTARRDENAALPDGFGLTTPTDGASINKLRFRDLDGKWRSLDEPAFAGKCRIIEVFGSWCPNCHDAAAHLAELHERYRGRGLSIVGLAFEATGDFERDARQVRRFIERHKLSFPILLAGVADKEKASAALPIIDRLRAYPTAIFADAGGRIRAIHTGYAGPAAQDEHARLRERFCEIIDRLLAAE